MPTQALIAILDSVVPLGYDFVYLRMDFRNRCNVGYAFVNFVDPTALWVFAATKMNTKWMIFSSEKVLQLSFANVQGKEAVSLRPYILTARHLIDRCADVAFLAGGGGDSS